MAFDSHVIWMAGLCEIVLPSRTVRLCDGAFVDWGGDLFTSEDAQFGTIDSVDSVSDGVGDEAAGGKLTMLPPSLAASSELFQVDAQGSPMRFWLAEIDPATGAVTGTPELLSWSFLDTLEINVGRARRAVEIEFADAGQRLFWTKEGNVLSSRFHTTAWPGEKGFDHATGVPSLVPWGVAGPGRGTTAGGLTGLGGSGLALGGGSVVSA